MANPFRARRSRCTRSCCRAAAVSRPRAWVSRACASSRKAGTRRASSAAGPATLAAHHVPVASTICCPHSVGVMQARAATMSATVSSPVCPMPVKTGLVAVAIARTTASFSKAARSARAPPPRTTAMTSQSLRLSAVTARAIEDGAAGPCTVTRTCETRNPNPDP